MSIVRGKEKREKWCVNSSLKWKMVFSFSLSKRQSESCSHNLSWVFCVWEPEVWIGIELVRDENETVVLTLSNLQEWTSCELFQKSLLLYLPRVELVGMTSSCGSETHLPNYNVIPKVQWNEKITSKFGMEFSQQKLELNT